MLFDDSIIEYLAIQEFFFRSCEERTYYQRLPQKGRELRDRRIPRQAIRPYVDSPFRFLFESMNDQALSLLTHCDYEVFNELLTLFKPVFDRYRPTDDGRICLCKTTQSRKVLGRKRSIDATGCLGLVLLWYRTQGPLNKTLAMAFGQCSTPLYKWLKFGRCVLLSVLQHQPLAWVAPPSGTQVEQYK